MDLIMTCLTYSIEYGAMAILVFIVMMCIKICARQALRSWAQHSRYCCSVS